MDLIMARTNNIRDEGNIFRQRISDLPREMQKSTLERKISFLSDSPRSFSICLGPMQSSPGSAFLLSLGFLQSMLQVFTTAFLPQAPCGCVTIFCLPCADCQDLLPAKLLRSFWGRGDCCIQFRAVMLPAVARSRQPVPLMWPQGICSKQRMVICLVLA